MMHDKPKASRPAVSEETLALMVELLPAVESLRDLAAICGIDHQQVRRHIAPFVALMKLNGTLPKCVCGQDRFHPYGCTRTTRFRTPPATVVDLLRRRQIIDCIVRGEGFTELGRRFGVDRNTIKKYLRFLTPEQLAARRALRGDETPGPGKNSRRINNVFSG